MQETSTESTERKNKRRDDSVVGEAAIVIESPRYVGQSASIMHITSKWTLNEGHGEGCRE